MMSNPKPGQLVRIRYNRKIRQWMPLHNRVGVVRVVSKPTRHRDSTTRYRTAPRNHGIEVDGKLHVVPCGNLMAHVVEATPQLELALAEPRDEEH